MEFFRNHIGCMGIVLFSCTELGGSCLIDDTAVVRPVTITKEPDLPYQTPQTYQYRHAFSPRKSPEFRYPSIPPEQQTCLIENMYWEARSEGYAGMRAVAQVTINRVYAEKWPDTVCEVVYDPEQFSWTITIPRGYLAQRDLNKVDRAAIAQANQVLSQIRSNGYAGLGDGKSFAYYYHRKELRWKHRHRFPQLADIRSHRFYGREPYFYMK